MDKYSIYKVSHVVAHTVIARSESEAKAISLNLTAEQYAQVGHPSIMVEMVDKREMIENNDYEIKNK